MKTNVLIVLYCILFACKQFLVEKNGVIVYNMNKKPKRKKMREREQLSGIIKDKQQQQQQQNVMYGYK